MESTTKYLKLDTGASFLLHVCGISRTLDSRRDIRPSTATEKFTWLTKKEKSPLKMYSVEASPDSPVSHSPFELLCLLLWHLLLGLVTWVSPGLLAGAWVGIIHRNEGTSLVSGYTTGKAPLSSSPLVPWTAYKSSEKCGWDFLSG